MSLNKGKHSYELFEKEIDNIFEHDKLLRFHSYSVRNALQEILIDIIRDKGEEYFTPRINIEYFRVYSQNKNVKEAERCRRKMKKDIETFSVWLLQIRSGSHQLINLDNMTGELLHFFKKCLSDVVSIMLLELTYIRKQLAHDRLGNK